VRLPRKFGVAAVQSKIDDAFPYHSNAAVKVHVTNAESNAVVLPVQWAVQPLAIIPTAE